ncbi:hypothetical protein EC844_109120 [Acinetobacter calcoaceticus]|uniref:Uncharacterized protein n=1 Tax=Acinetobacter calcoaceticus TaxID=471 RepID=A0A4V2R179_ACICA|nr:hypothetical protein EC844_109120 [Acinetobacter calcoaceticus]
MDIQQQLAQLIEEAYTLFAAYPLGQKIAVCHEFVCCLQQSDIDLLHSTPVRELDRRVIYEYLDAGAGEDDVLLAQQMKHLLPRVLDLLLQGERLAHSTEIIFAKLHCELTEVWTATEIEFMQRFALCYFQYKALHLVDHDLATDDFLDCIIIMFNTAGLEISTLLDQWLILLEYPQVMLDFINIIKCCLNDGVYDQSYADEKLQKQITAWLKHPQHRSKILIQLIKLAESNDLTEHQRLDLLQVMDQLKLN